MKKLVFLLLAVMMLTACGQDKENNQGAVYMNITAEEAKQIMNYYRSLGEHRFLLETWSGNKRMLGCARKLGFSEVKRRKDAYVVDGVEYDELLLEKRFDD